MVWNFPAAKSFLRQLDPFFFNLSYCVHQIWNLPMNVLLTIQFVTLHILSQKYILKIKIGSHVELILEWHVTTHSALSSCDWVYCCCFHANNLHLLVFSYNGGKNSHLLMHTHCEYKAASCFTDFIKSSAVKVDCFCKEWQFSSSSPPDIYRSPDTITSFSMLKPNWCDIMVHLVLQINRSWFVNKMCRIV